MNENFPNHHIKFLDKSFSVEAPESIPIEKLNSLVEKFISNEIALSTPLPTISKILLGSEYYILRMKQVDRIINSVDEIKKEIPITLDLIHDMNKIKRITKYHLHSEQRF